MYSVFIFLLCIAICGAARSQSFEVPTPKVEALYPRGFRVSLPDNGYSFFGFRGNINKEFQRLNDGEIKHDIVSPKNGQWVYQNRDVELEIGDTVYYWIYVLKNGKGRMVSDLAWTVSEFVTEDGTAFDGQSSSAPSSNGPGLSETSLHGSSPNPAGKDNLNPRHGTCASSKTIVQGQATVCQNALLFSEDFEVSNLKDLQKWDPEISFPGEPDYPFNMYSPEKTVSFEGGSLVITPLLTESQTHEGFLHETLDFGGRCTGQLGTTECRRMAAGSQILPPVMTAKLTTRYKFSFKFGRIEVRAKLPNGNWLIPEINLESSENLYGPKNYESGLLRVAFSRGNPALAKKLYGGPVLSDAEPFRSKLLKEKIGLENWNKDYHNYTIVWKPDGIEVLVDGEQYGSIDPGEGFYEAARNHNVDHASHWLKGTVMAPLDHMFHITLGLRVGGVNDFADNLPDKPWRNSASKAMLNFWQQKESWLPSWYDSALKIEYVKVYAL